MSLLLTFHFLTILAANLSLNPLNLASLLLFSALISGVILASVSVSWFFYFLVLVFLGGVMVVILFMCSVCTNKKMFINKNISWKLPLLLIFCSSMTMKKIILPMNFFSSSLMMSLFLKETSTLLVFLLIALLVCMICVIFISKLDEGPLLKSY